MDIYFIYLILILVLVEYILSIFWYAPYYRYGLPVYRRKIHISKFKPGFAEKLERYQDAGAARPLVFRAISYDEIAFREKVYGLYWIDYAPVIRGLIHLSEKRRSVMLTAKVNWYALLIPVLFLFMVRSIGNWAYILIILVIFLAIYVFQRHRFDKVGNLLEKNNRY